MSGGSAAEQDGRARRRKDLAGWVLIALSFVALAGGGAAYTLLRPPPTDAETLCRTDAPLRAHTLILVDATDKLEPRHRKRLSAALLQERAKLAPYDRLTILALRPDQPAEPRVLFSLCLPRDASTANPLFENPARLQARWDESIGKALQAAQRRAGATAPAPVSPIVAAVRAAVADPDFTSAAQRRFVLISDLLENDPAGFSIYRAAAADPAPALARPAALEGVSVRVIPLDRGEDAARQDAARSRLWAPFFEASGATEVSWDPAG
jgi:hypothetical protein